MLYRAVAETSVRANLKPRRSLISVAVSVGVVTFACGGFVCQRVEGKTTTPPNIVLIVADDLGYRELGCYGQKKIETPHLDRLASEGMRFTQAYCGNAVCAPSRCVLMTGRHPGHASIRNNSEHPVEGQQPILASELTMAELLQRAGYQCGAFGKWGLGYPGSEGDPLNQGFHRFFGYNCQRHAHSYYPDYLWSDRERVTLNNNPPVPGHAGLAEGADRGDPASYARFQGADYAPDRINEQALRFIRDHQSTPFFLYYPSVIPHVALHIPDEHLAPYLAKGWHDPPFTRDGGGYTPHFTPRAAYAAMISRLDTYVGRILHLLDELDLADNTLVLFSSDNGTTHLREEVDYEFFQSVGELRGLKGSLYEGGIRVPLIARWPGHVPAGSVSHRLVGFEDLLPTLASVANRSAAVPEAIDGIDILPTLRGQSQPERESLYREFAGYGGQQSVRFGHWKGVRQNLQRAGQPVRTELYNLDSDPGERHDVASEFPDVRAYAERIMRREHTPSERFPIAKLDRADTPPVSQLGTLIRHGYAMSDEVPIHYVAAGDDGPLIVLLHGFPDYWYSWRDQIPQLASHARVVAIDQRGYNLSGHPQGVESYRMEELVGDVAAVLDHMEEPTATIIGHDWGGAVAWHFAMAHPERIDRLVVLNLPHPRGISRELANNQQQQQNSAYARHFQTAGAENSISPTSLAGWVKEPAARAKYERAMERSSLPGMLNYYRANYPRPPYQEIRDGALPTIRCPVLVVHGLDDTYLLSDGLNNTWDWIDAPCTLVTVPGAGHFVHRDRPEFVTTVIDRWLRGTRESN